MHRQQALTMTIPSFRLINLAIFLLCSFLMAVAFYMEFIKGFEPCPLCMAQRVAVTTLGVVALLSFLQNPQQTGRKIYSLLLIIASAFGIGLASRQVWLQSLPEDLVPACGPGIYYMLDAFPISDTITSMLMGSGDCAEVVWRDPVIGLSIPGWTLVWFSFMAMVSLFQLVRKPT